MSSSVNCQMFESIFGKSLQLKLVYITSFFPPDRVAGAELGTHFMAEYMAGLGHEVHVVITRPHEQRPVESRSGYKIHWLKPPSLKGFKFIQEINRGLECLREIKPDLIHANCLLPGGYIAARYSYNSPCKSLVLCYGYDVCDMKFPLSLFGKTALREVDQAMAATNFCSEVMKSWVPEVIPKVFLAGCDVRVFPELPSERSEEVIKLLFIGRLIPEKGFDFLLDLMQELPEKYELNVLGAGQALTDYQNRASSLGQRIHFIGQVPNSECSKWLAESHALVLPSYREPFGVVCIEAIVSGVPVVCSDVMGLPEAVADQVNGLVVSRREKSDWVKAIQKACEDMDFRKNVYEESKKYRNKWDWQTRLKELQGIYETMLSP